ncbi:MAG TPA: hypothetical protein VN420_04245 [Candidatus Fimivivens sp.]|nr:hypothetical protein [Candidatus Fimivivens sp.]
METAEAIPVAIAGKYFVVGDYPFTDVPRVSSAAGERKNGAPTVIELSRVRASDSTWEEFTGQLESDEMRNLAEKRMSEHRDGGGKGSTYAIFAVRTEEGMFSARMSVTGGRPPEVRIVGVDTSDLTRVLIGIDPREVADRVAKEKARRHELKHLRERSVIGIMCVVAMNEGSKPRILLTDDAVNPPELSGSSGSVSMGACLLYSVAPSEFSEKLLSFEPSGFPIRFKRFDREALLKVLKKDPRRTRSDEPFNRFSTNILNLVEEPEKLRAGLSGYIQDAYRFFGLLN